ncbi:unnamed protein product [Trifolium pratense]|uniref:Uncharacterized protein n=1 Tax=Trifolium pratense TaxID=57577 RepID=A0ACB0LAW6_TRIPR|nr:unnamed protein product [Trifolium pratense]
MISWIYNLSSHYNQVITAPPSTDGPTPATNQPISPPSNEPENNDESQFAVNNPSNKPKKKSMTYWTIDVREPPFEFYAMEMNLLPSSDILRVMSYELFFT